MSPTLLAAATVAGASYTLIPGPAFLALLGIGAGQGRRAGAGFLAGHLAGDVLWSTLALVAIVGARSVSPTLFDLLGLACGLYLGWLGLTALRTRRDAGGGLASDARRPLLRGLVFGLTNPKGYPVAVATFTALLSGSADALDWSTLPALLLAAFAGFLIADLILLVLVGAAWTRRLYRRHDLAITRASGALFIGFGIHAILEAVPGLLGRRG